MNNNNKRFASSVGGADNRRAALRQAVAPKDGLQRPERRPPQRHQDGKWVHPEQRPGPGPRPERPGYTQMPLRPMTAMPGDVHRRQEPQRPLMQGQRPPVQGQRPLMQGQRPSVQGQRPPVQGQRPPVQGQRPTMQGQRPPAQGQRPPVQGQRPPVQGQRPTMQGQRPPAQGQRPLMQGQRPPVQGQRPPVQGQRRPRPVDPRGKGPVPKKRPDPGQRETGWIVPEGSPVYTAEGIMYDRRGQGGRGAVPDPRRRGAAPAPKRKTAPKKKKVFNKERFLLHVKTFFIRFAVMIVIVSLLGVWWYRDQFFSDSSRRSGKVSFVMESVGSYEVPASAAYNGEVLYVDFSLLSQWMNMTSVGSVNSMRFICPEGESKTSSGIGGEEYAIFKSSSATAYVNGTSISLEAPCRTVDSHIWVPLSFVENYVNGVTCDRGAKGTDIVIVPDGAETAEEDEEIVIEASFKVKAQEPLLAVEYPQ